MRRRIELLCVDREGQLVVVELRSTEGGGHIELRALRYAAMLSTRTSKRRSQRYLRQTDAAQEPKARGSTEGVGHCQPLYPLSQQPVRGIGDRGPGMPHPAG